MSDDVIVDRILQAWRDVNLGSDFSVVGRYWSDATSSFVPFDSFEVLSGKDIISKHFVSRRAAMVDIQIAWSTLAFTLAGEEVVLTAEQFCTIRRNGVTQNVGQRLTFFGVATIGEDICFRHVTEAAPAVLPLMIAAYKRDARQFAR